ncbi:MAG: hypothetical protein ACI4NG_05040 [Candidatus Gallimonas sp.]
MINQLLALSTPVKLVIAVLCVVGLAILTYGFCRRFSKMGWTGWQIFILFFLTLLLGKIPVSQNKFVYFGIVVGVFFGCAALVFLAGGAVRAYFRSRTKRANWLFRTFDRILGALTAVVSLAALLFSIGGFALTILSVCTNLDEGALAVVYQFSIGGKTVWGVVGKYALDFFLVGLLALAVRGGYRLGLLRSVWTAVMMLLTVCAFAGAIVIAMKAPGISALSLKLIGAFSGSMNAVLAKILGYGIVALVAFVVLVVVIVLLNLLINLGVRELDRIKIVRFIDGGIFSIVCFCLAAALVCGVSFGIYAMVHGMLSSLGGIGATIGEFAAKVRLEELCTTSPLCKFFYEYNPILLLLNKG